MYIIIWAELQIQTFNAHFVKFKAYFCKYSLFLSVLYILKILPRDLQKKWALGYMYVFAGGGGGLNIQCLMFNYTCRILNVWKGFPEKVQEIPDYEEHSTPADSLHTRLMMTSWKILVGKEMLDMINDNELWLVCLECW